MHFSHNNHNNHNNHFSLFLSQIKHYYLNWIAILILFLIFIYFDTFTHPHNSFIPRDAWTHLEYPHHASTVPNYVVIICSILIPNVLFITYGIIFRCEIREIHNLIFIVFATCSVTGFITCILKHLVGRHRPDFFYRCYLDEFPENFQMTYINGYPPECTNGNISSIDDGLKSFPSGHSSGTISGMMLMTLFLIGKFKCYDGNGYFWKMLVSSIPLMFGFYVGITRIQDNRHHPTDVIAGFLIGCTVAIIIYLSYYPSPFKRHSSDLPLYFISEHDILRNSHTPIPNHSSHADDDLEQGQSSSIILEETQRIINKNNSHDLSF